MTLIVLWNEKVANQGKLKIHCRVHHSEMVFSGLGYHLIAFLALGLVEASSLLD